MLQHLEEMVVTGAFISVLGAIWMLPEQLVCCFVISLIVQPDTGAPPWCEWLCSSMV
jgi:hypothetical protein